jgi:glycoside/pentoside/hexuronide:cation symporter, GPH family
MTQISPAPDGASSGTATPSSDRLPRSTKLVYGLGSVNHMWGEWLYNSMVWPVFNIFLHVNPTLISNALLLNRVFDAVTDPLFGWLSDNTRSKWGRRRPFILIGSILMGLWLPVLFLAQPGWGQTAYFWFILGTLAVYTTFFSCFNMPYQSLGWEMTPDSRERTSIFSHKAVVQKAPELAMFFAAAFMTLSLFNDATGQPNILKGARTYGLILGAIMIVVGIVLFLFLRERYYEKVVGKQEKVKIAESIWRTLKCRPFRAQLAMVFAYGVCTSIVGLLGYYATIYYVCRGDVAVGSRWNFVMGITGMVFGLLGVPFWSWLAGRFGKKAALFFVQGIAIFVFISTWWLYTPEIQWLQVLATGLIAFIGAGFWMIDGSIGGDVIDYDELESGKRREGAFQASRSWILKFGFAIAAWGQGYLLDATGFDASLGGNQSEHAIFMIRLGLAGVPVIGLLIAMFFLARFPLTQAKMHDIRVQLEARRGTV